MIDVIFMCLPTPERKDAQGESDLSYYFAAAEQIAPVLKNRNGKEQTKYIVLINKSTVPIQMFDRTREFFESKGVTQIGVVSNPEFLVEGKAIEGSIRPDRVVVGASSEKDFEIMRQLYQRFYTSTFVKYIEVNPKEAEAGKLLANYLLFNRVVNTFEVAGRLCEIIPGMRFEEVRRVIITDPRIGGWGSYDSLYAGGSCFIKDAASLAHQIEEGGAQAHFVRYALEANSFQLEHFFARALEEAKFSFSGKTIALLGLAFKQDTNDIRNSPAISLVEHLLQQGVGAIQVYDPAAMDMFAAFHNPSHDPRYQKIHYMHSESEALTGTQAGMLITDWPQFRTMDELLLHVVQKPYLLMDGRRMLHQAYPRLVENGISIIAVGSPFLGKSFS